MGESIPDSDSEAGHQDQDETHAEYSSPGPNGFENLSLRSPTLETAMGELEVTSFALGRVYSNSSSQYAESEGDEGSDFGAGAGMADSLTLPAPGGAGGWVSTFQGGPVAIGALPVLGQEDHVAARLNGNGNGVGAAWIGGRSTWEDKPSFFEYLYGA